MTRTPSPLAPSRRDVEPAAVGTLGSPAPAPDDVEPRRGTLATYGELPRLAGKAFLPIAFLARLPFSMITIGTLLLVSTTTGSLALGGLASAAAAVGTALGGPTQGTLADRIGQRTVLLVVVPLNVLAVLGLVQAASAGAPSAVILGTAALVGAFAPQVGPLARVRWIAMTQHRPRTLLAAMGYESTADEIGFVLGPALVGILASVWSPQAAMLFAAGVCAVFGLAFALHPTATPGAPKPSPEASAAAGQDAHGSFAGLLRKVLVPVLGMLAMGMLFGSTQTAVTSFMRDAGSESQAGLVYAVLGFGSAITALAVVALPARFGARSRWVAFASGLTVAAVLTFVAGGSGSLGTLIGALALLGLFVGPVMVTIFTVGGDLSPTSRSGAAMTMLASANVVGVAIGASLGGQVAEGVGTAAAFALPAVAAVLLVVTGLSLRSRPAPVDAPAPSGAPGVR
ncbi:MFS transporter [Oerskovia sp. NPDC060287]|uniref:MFS transporter n=1 Tax=Oerskovia sp. NPDC060287 TaxID=3347095 RepID=UPI00364639E4